jgi:sec-independent protein translocase protein TatB
MPSFQDSAVIFFIALLLFGPKKLPELARQLGKLMGEFRRASNEFRMQMEDELRMAEQAEQQKKIAEMQAAAPVAPAIAEVSENTIAQPSETIDNFATDQNHEFKAETVAPVEPLPMEPLPIATSGELNLMPPSTGLPVASSSVSHAFDSIPRVSSNSDVDRTTTEAPVHG